MVEYKVVDQNGDEFIGGINQVLEDFFEDAWYMTRLYQKGKFVRARSVKAKLINSIDHVMKFGADINNCEVEDEI